MADQQPDGERTTPDAPDQIVHLPALIADEFGVARSVVRMAIGMGKVEVDGKDLGVVFDVNRSQIEGKEIVVTGEERQYKMVYDSDDRQRYFR
jgi:hypothetical protein